MDESGQRDNRRHRMDYYKVPPWNVISQYQIKEQNAFHVNTKLTMLCDERDAAIQERDRALHEKKIALDERDAAIHQRDAAMADRDNAIRERDNAIAALQFQESTMNSLLHRPKHNVKSPSNLGEKFNPGAFPISVIPSQDTYKLDKVSRTKAKKSGFASLNKSPRKAKKINGDLNRHVTTDGTKAEWDAQDFGSMSQIQFNESTMPVPVCSCTGEARHCYKWGNGGWQSSCCTTSLSVYPLPQMPNKKHSRMGGRKMSGSVFSRLLTRLASAGHDLSTPVDLKNYWAKHGTNRYITIK